MPSASPIPAYGLDRLRAEFPIVAEWAYLNHAGVAPLANRVRAAMTSMLDTSAQAFIDWSIEQFRAYPDQARNTVAQLIHAAPDEIAWVQNTSVGLNLVASSLPLRPGDNIVLCDIEFPSNVYPWLNLQRRGVEVRLIPPDGGGLTVAALEANTDARTRLVTTSAVQFLTGFRADLAAIGDFCRARNLYFAVDGIQSLGHIPLDVRACQVDFLATGALKSLMGPPGQGFLYIRRERLEELQPAFCGPVSVVDYEQWLDFDLTFRPGAARFEQGTYNWIGLGGMVEAIQMLLELGIENVERWTCHLSGLLMDDLDRHGYRILSNPDPRRRSAIVSFATPGPPEQAFERLKTAGVMAAVREGYLRISPHCYNTEEEIARVCQVLGPARASGGSGGN
jgi:selenocysteine lyase/cysteine desulfurase